MSAGFAAMGLMPELVKCVEEEYGWLLPTDIQDEAIPLILGGGDVMAAAETGSGKTAAFALPIIQLVYERLKYLYDEAKELPSSASKSSNPESITINGEDKDSSFHFVVAENGISCQVKADDPAAMSSNSWSGARASHGVNSGNFYYECRINSSSREPTCRLGWSTIASHLELGKDKHGIGYGGKGFLSSGGSFEKYGETFGPGDVIGCCISLSSSSSEDSVSFLKNGEWQAKPVPLPARAKGSVYFPAILLQGGHGGAACTVNFGDFPFVHGPPPGYSALSACPPSSLFCSSSDREVYLTAGAPHRRPLAVVVEPTIELAEQTFQCIADLCSRVPSPPSIRCQLFAGNSNSNKRKRDGDHDVDIVVGTMGKLLGMVSRSKGRDKEDREGDRDDLDLSQVRLFVLDEADKLVADSGISAVSELFSLCPGGGAGVHRLQVCFFSATLHSPQIRQLSERVCVNPTWVDLKGADSLPEAVHHVVYRVDPAFCPDVDLQSCKIRAVTDGVHDDGIKDQRSRLSQQLKELKQHLLVKIIQKYKMEQCVVFCRTNVDCMNLESFLRSLREAGTSSHLSCSVLAGRLSQDQRKASLDLFKQGTVDILICTDVGARGLDISGIPFVVNMTLPDERSVEDYIHRVGRVGRAGRMGLAISLVAADNVLEKVWYHTCSNPLKCSNRGVKGGAATDGRGGGGCCIWYDESQVLQRVEKRLQQKIATMLPGSDFALPEEIAGKKVSYGVDVIASESSSLLLSYSGEHLQALSAVVKDLAEMETEAQNVFLKMSLFNTRTNNRNSGNNAVLS